MSDLNDKELDERKFQFSLIKYQIGYDFTTNFLLTALATSYALIIGGIGLGENNPWSLPLVITGVFLAFGCFLGRLFFNEG